MTDKQFINAKQVVLCRLYEDKEKELQCHVQFVLRMGLELAEKYQVDPKIIELSCLLHDIGRSHEEGDEDHGDSGARIAKELLKDTGIASDELEIILKCIQNHTKKLHNYTIEQKIIITADGASKVLYHEAFILLCKKQSYREKLEWGRKYLEKGFRNTLFPESKRMITKKYKSLKETYDSIPAQFDK
jgi:putative nucleotidyltransferase with HDIG domain